MDRTSEDATSAGEVFYGAPVRAVERHAGFVLVLPAAPSYDRMIAALERACAGVPRLRQRRVKRRGGRGTAWLPDPRFELSFHLRWERPACDPDVVPTATLRFFQPLARHRPPWELHVLEGPGRTVVLIKLDPELERDGSGTALLDRLVDEEGVAAQDPPAEEPDGDRAAVVVREVLERIQRRALEVRDTALALAGTAREAARLSEALARRALGAPARDDGDWPGDLGAAALRTARSLGALLTERLAESSPRPLLAAAGVARGLALVDLPVAALDAVRASLGLGMESVLLAITAGALGRLTGAPGAEAAPAPAATTLRVLISFPGGCETSLLLPLGAESPVDRVRSFDALLGALGGGRRLAAMKQITGAVAALPRALAHGLGGAAANAHDLEIGYRRGVCDRGTLAGIPLRRVYPLTARCETGALAVAALHGEQSLTLGLSYDRGCVKRPAELVRAWREAWNELLDAALVAAAIDASEPPEARRPALG